MREDFSDATQVTTYATVFIPADQYSYFLNKLEEYNTEVVKSGKPKNKNLIESIEGIRPALLRAFWTDNIVLLPRATPIWCELWVRAESQAAEAIRNSTFYKLETLGIEFKNQFIQFPQRIVLLIKANESKLIELFASFDLIAELRSARETAEFWTNLPPFEQASWANDLSNRISFSPGGRVAVCLLDEGINNGHTLLSDVVADSDCMAVNPNWLTDDNGGHGTAMAGLTIFGDLELALQSTDIVEIKHHLESVKILPPHGRNQPDLYGDITRQGVSTAEINEPRRKNRIFCMAVTTNESMDKGRPSSWSAALDIITSGYLDDVQRLFVISAGNVFPLENDYIYPDTNLLSEIENPAQSWNALTVGAYTEKVVINDQTITNYASCAQVGQLSPFSSTSLLWGEKSKWPLKPDVVMEGGNIAKVGVQSFEHHSLECLTTYFRPTQRQFDTINATSAATAKASWLAAQIWEAYPQAWPETIRALIVHSAKWTEAMKLQFLTNRSKLDYRKLLQTCGFGVPSLEKALYSFDNSLMLIAQELISPFRKEKDAISANEMHLYTLPWPKEALADLGAQDVTLRITLSYFIEPSPGERGWRNRYQYASHGLRFDINRPTETRSVFTRRINAAIQAEEDEIETTETGRLNWCIGSNNRHLGSIHSDWLTISGAELSTMDNIAIYPVRGWWKERKKEDRWNKIVRYSLLVSIETPSIEIDLYTPIQNLIRVPITIP